MSNSIVRRTAGTISEAVLMSESGKYAGRALWLWVRLGAGKWSPGLGDCGI